MPSPPLFAASSALARRSLLRDRKHGHILKDSGNEDEIEMPRRLWVGNRTTTVTLYPAEQELFRGPSRDFPAGSEAEPQLETISVHSLA